jgi:tetratricopeptide (TPR) repeat protein
MDVQAYQTAKEALKDKDYKAAERAFKKTLESIDESAKQYNSVLSGFGLSQVLNAEANGLLMCRDAASNEVFDGGVFLNLACAEWHSNNRKRAVDAVRRGVKIDPDHEQLNRACAKLDCRKKCCFSFLPRGHKLNRLFGRMRRRPGAMTTVDSLLY